MFKVLTIDGGGLRGAFAARFLERCEANGVRLSEHVDLVVGTSTGGIIALAAAYQKPMANILELYRTYGGEIFQPPTMRSLRKTSFLRSKYDNSVLIHKLQEEFGLDARFDLPSCAVRVQSFDLQTGSSKIFRAGDPYRDDSKFFVWQVAAATSAAPTYFDTFRVPDHGIFVDGGIWANNPAIVGLVEALALRQELRDVLMLSLGTGEKIFRTTEIRTGKYSWRNDFVDLLFQSQSTGVHHLANKLGSEMLGFYHRICPPLRDSETAFDDPRVVPTLVSLADKFFDDEWPRLERQYFA